MFARRNASDQNSKRDKHSRDHCANRSQWRVAPGKAPERLSPHYQLGCDYGSALIDLWKGEGTEPLYVCDGHVAEFTRLDRSASLAKPREDKKQTTEPQEPAAASAPNPSQTVKAAPPPASTAAQTRPNGGSRAAAVGEAAPVSKVLTSQERGKAARAVKHSTEQRSEVSRLISEQVARLDAVLAQSEARIIVADVIDSPLEQASLQIIDAEMPEAKKDAVIAHLQKLQTTLKVNLGEEITLSTTNKIRKTVADLLKGTEIPEEAKPACAALQAALQKAIHAAAPKSKHYEDRLQNLYKIKAGLGSQAG
jgi:hypothetical protein